MGSQNRWEADLVQRCHRGEVFVAPGSSSLGAQGLTLWVEALRAYLEVWRM